MGFILCFETFIAHIVTLDSIAMYVVTGHNIIQPFVFDSASLIVSFISDSIKTIKKKKHSFFGVFWKLDLELKAVFYFPATLETTVNERLQILYPSKDICSGLFYFFGCGMKILMEAAHYWAFISFHFPIRSSTDNTAT